jgi:pimeloyl-ACP methyl ester carboxylesterase
MPAFSDASVTKLQPAPISMKPSCLSSLLPLRPAVCATLLFPLALLAASNQTLIPERFSQPAFSSDGRYLAMMSMDDAGNRFVIVTECATMKPTLLVVIDQQPGQDPQPKSVTSYAWASADRLVLTSNVKSGANALHFAEAGKRSVSAGRRDARYEFIAAEPDTGTILVAARPTDDRHGECRVLRLRARDLAGDEVVYSCQSRTFECLADRDGRLRMIKRDETEGGTPAWFLRDPETSTWKKTGVPHWSRVFGFDYTGNLILVGGEHNSEHPGIQYYDLGEDRFVHTLVGNDRYAMNEAARPLFSDGLRALVGMHVDGDYPTTKWISPEFKRFQDSINQVYTDSRNRIVAWNTDLKRLLVERVYEDWPSQYFIVDNEKAALKWLCTNGGQVDRTKTARQEYVSFENQARVRIGGYLTVPRSAAGKSTPLVILVPADPWYRKNRYGWDCQAQFLAVQGYAVLRLNFRGSGWLAGAGRIDWMTRDDVRKPFEDIADAIDFLAREKGIDGGRVAIVGLGGGGGWMAAYAPVALPGRFRCAAALAGIYDLEDYRQTEVKPPLRDLGNLPFAEADRSLSIEDLRALSPIHNLGPKVCPLYIEYGRWTNIRHAEHAEAFLRAAKKAGVEVEKPALGEWYAADLGRQKAIEEYANRLAEFLKKRL